MTKEQYNKHNTAQMFKKSYQKRLKTREQQQLIRNQRKILNQVQNEVLRSRNVLYLIEIKNKIKSVKGVL